MNAMVQWMQPGSKKWHLIYYILTRKCETLLLQCWTDHRQFLDKRNFVVKPKVRTNNVELPKWIHVNKLKLPSVNSNFVTEINNLSCDRSWNSFKERVYEVFSNILGFVVKKHQYRFGDNDDNIGLNLEEKRKAFNMLNSDFSTNRTADAHFKAVKVTLQRKQRMMQENWWSDRCDEIQEASNANHSKRFYSLLKKVDGPTSSTVAPLCKKDGT
uniref:Uncharacterized protein n=1 Tax=Octopus bimaculoides TaxID=37653 RepID=A0A0L8GZD7_OCTBM